MQKFIYTPSGGRYVYITETNQILTINADADEECPREEWEATIIDELYSAQIMEGKSPDRILWPNTAEEYVRRLQGGIPALVLEITQQCTLRCDYCLYSGNYFGVRTHRNLNMDIDIMKRGIDYYAEHNVDHPTADVTFYGGEPLLRFDDIRTAVEYTREQIHGKPLSFHISSNGTLLDERILEWLASDQDVSLSLTLNGYSHDRYRHFASGEGSLSKIMDTLDFVKERYPALWSRIDFLANLVSFSELLSLREFYFKHIGKPPVLLTGILTSHGNESIKNITSEAEADAYAPAKAKRLFYKTNDPYIKPYLSSGVAAISTRSISLLQPEYARSCCCMPFTTALFIDAEGAFGICERAGSDARLGCVEGGIDISACKSLMNEALALFNEKCRSCWAQRLCNICYQHFWKNDAGALCLPEETCINTKLAIEDDLVLFCEIGEENPALLQSLQKEYQESLTASKRAT